MILNAQPRPLRSPTESVIQNRRVQRFPSDAPNCWLVNRTSSKVSKVNRQARPMTNNIAAGPNHLSYCTGFELHLSRGSFSMMPSHSSPTGCLYRKRDTHPTRIFRPLVSASFGKGSSRIGRWWCRSPPSCTGRNKDDTNNMATAQ